MSFFIFDLTDGLEQSNFNISKIKTKLYLKGFSVSKTLYEKLNNLNNLNNTSEIINSSFTYYESVLMLQHFLKDENFKLSSSILSYITSIIWEYIAPTIKNRHEIILEEIKTKSKKFQTRVKKSRASKKKSYGTTLLTPTATSPTVISNTTNEIVKKASEVSVSSSNSENMEKSNTVFASTSSSGCSEHGDIYNLICNKCNYKSNDYDNVGWFQ
ncbi:1451_t:CDS:2 [Dentiscutata heterogama]|uniref:1451_t:CDS:1 n=1 Tax=Dentiscutata heterogama TaxID=1316150 RepID=A0ACA9MQV7_9GLOM|nr:1451_t:CDS:2 [Dentiscutata heterogama]